MKSIFFSDAKVIGKKHEKNVPKYNCTAHKEQNTADKQIGIQLKNIKTRLTPLC
jgi:hypothetical protein